MSHQYFNISPVLSSITAIAVSKMAKGKRLLASCQGLQSTPAQSVAAANAIASAVAPRDLKRVPYAGPVGPPFCWDLILDALGSFVAGSFFCCERFVFKVSLALGAVAVCTLRADASHTLRVGVSSTLEGGGSCTI